MPLYEYECDACHHRFEVIQKMSDPRVEKCPKCGSTVRKLMSSPAIQFKGSGFYITDYAKKDHVAAAKADRAESSKQDKSEKSEKSDQSGKSDKAESSTKAEKSGGETSSSGDKAAAPASAPKDSAKGT